MANSPSPPPNSQSCSLVHWVLTSCPKTRATAPPPRNPTSQVRIQGNAPVNARSALTDSRNASPNGSRSTAKSGVSRKGVFSRDSGSGGSDGGDKGSCFLERVYECAQGVHGSRARHNSAVRNKIATRWNGRDCSAKTCEFIGLQPEIVSILTEKPSIIKD